jgi:hypothetical protein
MNVASDGGRAARERRRAGTDARGRGAIVPQTQRYAGDQEEHGGERIHGDAASVAERGEQRNVQRPAE